MGAAAAELAQDAGAEVVVMDFAEVTLAGAKAIHVNLAERASIDAAVDECGGPVDALFSCAGVADGTPGIERINFIGHRAPHRPLLASGTCSAGARPSGSSRRRPGSAGRPTCRSSQELLATPDFDSGVAVDRAHSQADYMSTKQAICAYVAARPSRSSSRASASTPSALDRPSTPLAQANKETWLGFGADYRDEVGIEPSTPLEQAYPLVFLCSDAAVRHQRHHHGHRRRLHELGRHRLLPAAPPPSPACCSAADRQGRSAAAGGRSRPAVRVVRPSGAVRPLLGITATEGMLAVAPHRTTVSTTRIQARPPPSGRRASRLRASQSGKSFSHGVPLPAVDELRHRRSLATGTVTHDDIGEAHRGMLLPRNAVHQLHQRRLAGDVDPESGPRRSERGRDRGQVDAATPAEAVRYGMAAAVTSAAPITLVLKVRCQASTSASTSRPSCPTPVE